MWIEENPSSSYQSTFRYVPETENENCADGKFSRLFGTRKGIQQGGIVSPVLFCVYMDTLLKRLESEGYGCWIGSHFMALLVMQMTSSCCYQPYTDLAR